MEIYVEADTQDSAEQTFKDASVQELEDESEFVEMVSIDEET